MWLCHSQGWVLGCPGGTAGPGLGGSTGVFGRPLGTCRGVLPKPGTSLGGRRPGGWAQQSLLELEGKRVEMLPYTRQEVSSTQQIPSCPGKAFVLNLSFSWAKVLRITALHMSCSVQEEQTCRIKGAPLWGEREWVEGSSVNQLSGVLAFSWWIRLCRCFVAWLTKRLIWFFFFFTKVPSATPTAHFYQAFYFNTLEMQYRTLNKKEKPYTHLKINFISSSFLV